MFKEIIILCLLSCGCVPAIKEEYHNRFKRDITPLTLKSFTINSFIHNHFATVILTGRVINEQAQAVNSSLMIKIPKDAFISNFSMDLEGYKYIGMAVPNEDVEDYNRNQTMISTAGVRQPRSDEQPFSDKQLDAEKERNVDNYRIDLTLAANTEATFSLTYEERLVIQNGHYTQRIAIQPSTVVETLIVNAIVVEKQGFENFSYSLPNSNKSFTSTTDLSDSTVRGFLRQITVDEQNASSSTKGINGDVVIQYDLKGTTGAGNMIVQDKYFVHYFTPSGLKPMDKNILFVIDRSGSMSGTKINQVRESMTHILDRLNPNDYFNILTFSSNTKAWLGTPVVANLNNVEEAKQFLNSSLVAGGGTRMNTALSMAIQSIRTLPENDRRAQIIVLLTDGKPGTSPETIRRNVMKKNERLAAIYCLGYGANVNSNFLKNLAEENRGFYRAISVNDDANEQLVNFYTEIKDPLLLDVVVSYDSQYVELNSTTKNKFYQYFDGSEIVVSGKLKKSGILPGKAVHVQGISKDGNLSLTMDDKSVSVLPKDAKVNNKRLQAYGDIKEWLSSMVCADITTCPFKETIVASATGKNNFVTPYTSYVLVRSEKIDKVSTASTSYVGISTIAGFLILSVFTGSFCF